MDFDSLTEFPPISQVMSPSAGAQGASSTKAKHDKVTGETLARQIRALVTDVSEPSTRPGLRRCREEGGDEAARRDVPETREAARRVVPATHVRPMEPLRLRTLDTDHPAGYANWRLAAKAAILCRADDPKLDVYISLIDDARYAADQVAAQAQADAGIRVVDRLLYSALIECIEGGRREFILDELRTTVPFGSGCLVLRCLDKKFGQANERAKVAATAELLNLKTAGRSAKDLDAFLSRFRVLVATAGSANAGPAVQVEVLQRVAVGHPVLGPVLMAWRQAGCLDPAVLREKIEDIVAEGLAGPTPGHSVATAWAALDHSTEAAGGEYATRGSEALLGPDGAWAAHAGQPAASAHDWAAWAAAAAAFSGTPSAGGGEGLVCWGCGKRGHRQRQCPEKQRSGDGARSRLDNIEETLSKLAAELRAMRSAARAGASKK